MSIPFEVIDLLNDPDLANDLLSQDVNDALRDDALEKAGEALTLSLLLMPASVALVIRPEDTDTLGKGIRTALATRNISYQLACLWLDYVEFGDPLVSPRHLIRKQVVEPLQEAKQIFIAVSMLDDPEPVTTMWHRVRRPAGEPPVVVLAATATENAEERLKQAMNEAGADLRAVRCGLMLGITEEQKQSLPRQLSRGFRLSAQRPAVPELVKRRLSLLGPGPGRTSPGYK